MAKKEPAPEGAGTDTSVQEQPKTLTPNEWARVFFPPLARGRQHPDLWKHGAAEALHGWKAEEHHAGRPMQLTEQDYAAALGAAVKPNPTPHAAALSRFLKQAKD